MTDFSPERIRAKIAQGRRHIIVFLKPGPVRDQDEAGADEIQLGHLRHLFRLIEDKQIRVNGPVLGSPTVLGVSIYESADRAEVEALVRADPAVVAGRLSYEIFEWFSIDGFGYPAP